MTIAATALFWEPVAGTGERLTVAALISVGGEVSGHILIRDEVLRAFYGDATDKLTTLFNTVLTTYIQIRTLAGDPRPLPPLLGITAGATIQLAVASKQEALRVIALMHSSLAILDHLDSKEDKRENQHSENQRFASQVKAQVSLTAPRLLLYFDQHAALMHGGETVSFGFASPRVLLHFTALHPVRQMVSIKDARSKLWELERAQNYSGIKQAGLMMSIPAEHDPMIGDTQRKSLRSNIENIKQEAGSASIRLWPVTSIGSASDTLCELDERAE